MKKKFINKNGEEKLIELPKDQKVPFTGLYENGGWWQRKYPSWVIRLNAWISRRNADILRYF